MIEWIKLIHSIQSFVIICTSTIKHFTMQPNETYMFNATLAWKLLNKVLKVTAHNPTLWLWYIQVIVSIRSDLKTLWVHFGCHLMCHARMRHNNNVIMLIWLKIKLQSRWFFASNALKAVVECNALKV